MAVFVCMCVFVFVCCLNVRVWFVCDLMCAAVRFVFFVLFLCVLFCVILNDLFI